MRKFLKHLQGDNEASFRREASGVVFFSYS